MKMTQDERLSLERIAAICGKDPKLVGEIFKGLLIATTLEILSSDENNAKITIPYLCNLEFSYCDNYTCHGPKVQVDFTCSANEGLKEEIRNVMDGESTPVVNYIKKNLAKSIQNILSLDNIEIGLEEENAVDSL